jgi:4-carboxymuconolactone decarboxylase
MSALERFEACERRASTVDLWQREKLRNEDRQAALIGGCLALSLPQSELEQRFKDLLAEGCTADFIEDIVRQIGCYIGYPKVRVAVIALEVITGHAATTPPANPIWMLSDDDRYAAGSADYNQLNPTALSTIRAAFDEAAPDLANLTFRAFGDLFASSRLSLRTRQFATVTALACLGGVAPQLRFHLGASLHVGITFEELVETVYIAQYLAGMPAAYNAMVELKAALESQGEPPPYK